MNTGGSVDAVARDVVVARACMDRGNLAAAETRLAATLRTAPGRADALRCLAHLRFLQGRREEAAEIAAAVSVSRPADPALRDEAARFRELAGPARRAPDLPPAPGGKLRIVRRIDDRHHRSGWRHAVESLGRLHHPDGVRFEDFVEDVFAWQHPRDGVRRDGDLLAAIRDPRHATRITSEEKGLVPIREPWVGVVHNPAWMPGWFHPDESLPAIFAKRAWRESLPSCVGLLTLSEHTARWLRRETGKPVSVVLHPTETPTLLFDYARFEANPRKCVVQVGWWLRRLGGIHRLPIPEDNPLGLAKVRLLPRFAPGAADHVRELHALDERNGGGRPGPGAGPVVDREHVSDEEYDHLLAENVVFVDLLAANANNAVVECIVRTTPILVNRLPAVEEYLGTSYPLYYSDPAEAARMALDPGRLRAAHDYLRGLPLRTRLDGGHFSRAVEASEVYGLL